MFFPKHGVGAAGHQHHVGDLLHQASKPSTLAAWWPCCHARNSSRHLHEGTRDVEPAAAEATGAGSAEADAEDEDAMRAPPGGEVHRCLWRLTMRRRHPRCCGTTHPETRLCDRTGRWRVPDIDATAVLV